MINPVSGIATPVASAGMLVNPVGVAVRQDGFAYLTDVGSHLILRIDPNPIPPAPVQVAVSGLSNLRGIALEPEPGDDAFVSSPNCSAIKWCDVPGPDVP